MAVAGLSRATDVALGGIARAHARAADAAHEVAAAAHGDSVTLSGGRAPDLVHGMVGLKLARYAAAANVATLRAVEAMSDDVLRIGR